MPPPAPVDGSMWGGWSPRHNRDDPDDEWKEEPVIEWVADDVTTNVIINVMMEAAARTARMREGRRACLEKPSSQFFTPIETVELQSAWGHQSWWTNLKQGSLTVLGDGILLRRSGRRHPGRTAQQIMSCSRANSKDSCCEGIGTLAAADRDIVDTGTNAAGRMGRWRATW